MKTVKIAFSNFYEDFNFQDNFILDSMRLRYDVRVVSADENPDILFFCCFGHNEHFKYSKPVRIYFTGENDVPNFNICDYAISFNPITFGNRHYRLPFYCTRDSFTRLRAGERILVDKPAERDFCSIVVSNLNWGDPNRRIFWQKLEQYKNIASGGRSFNNIGGAVKDKFEFISRYKFNLAFENSIVDGYTTEKIVDAFHAGTVPIYWGNRNISKDFNPEAYIDINDFDNIDNAIEYIKTVDRDDALYLRYLNASPLIDNYILNWENTLADFLLPAVNGIKHIPKYGMAPILYNNLLIGDKLRSLSKIIPNTKFIGKMKSRIHKILTK